jgi:hypothetical protein
MKISFLCRVSVISVLLLTGYSKAANAAGPDATPAAATSTPPNSGDDYTGDKLILKANTRGFRLSQNRQAPQEYCAPEGSAFRVTKEVKDSLYGIFKKISDTKNRAKPDQCNLTLVDENHVYVIKIDDLWTTNSVPDISTLKKSGVDYAGAERILKVNTRGFHLPQDIQEPQEYCAPKGSTLRVTEETNDSLYGTFEDVNKNQDRAEPNKWNLTLVDENYVYVIEKSKLLTTSAFDRTGFTFGALVVPFKVQLSDHSINSSATIAPYVGYKFSYLSSSIASVVAAGMSTVSVATEQNGAASTESRSAFSAAAGFVGTSTKNNGNFQFGFLFGRDWVGSDAQTLYKYDGKTWVAVSIGVTFIE